MSDLNVKLGEWVWDSTFGVWVKISDIDRDDEIVCESFDRIKQERYLRFINPVNLMRSPNGELCVRP